MMLAMLYPGTQSLAFYEKGVSVLKFDMSTALPTPVAGDDWSISLASAYTSIAELYMTDLCMEAKAESECKRVLQLAVEADPENIEALQTFASYYISACDKDQARQAIAKSVSLWLKVEEIEKLKAGGLTEEEAIGGMDTESLPSYEFRINTARILSELEMYKEALLVLSRLEKEDDEVVEVWYMHGIVAQLIQDHTTAIECLREAEKLFVKTGCPDHEVLSHIKSILETYEKEGLINSDGSLNADAGEDMSE
ncbi:hypothetical protein SARC_12517 [Sphaeroforma arctica JP610]|uniref:Uncharacterized protein n=1 Tax=Sphaeroforma arctica JP610 TaxID=667725 RepID=A0A0L0FDV8_9EUKA|nr:hypothetical protein SARC_12517 [Sphaeroforma arctica JP610]KNC74949.1 hypothetical protein SARC_12517 [Sphaeroforma arctica JP610]|eukprot:XP_014148851.1 hypothetical protein SARC_12517 [Sphaeroforma arctica JP610]